MSMEKVAKGVGAGLSVVNFGLSLVLGSMMVVGAMAASIAFVPNAPNAVHALLTLLGSCLIGGIMMLRYKQRYNFYICAVVGLIGSIAVLAMGARGVMRALL